MDILSFIGVVINILIGATGCYNLLFYHIFAAKSGLTISHYDMMSNNTILVIIMSRSFTALRVFDAHSKCILMSELSFELTS